MDWAETLMLRPEYIVMGLGKICDSSQVRHVLDYDEIQMMRPDMISCDDRENVYFILLSSSNRKYESLTIV